VLPLALRTHLWYHYYKFHISNNTFSLFTIYLLILQCTNYNHITIVFPSLPILDTHNRLFCRPSAAYNSSILAHFQNGDQQKTSNTDNERVSTFQLQRPSQKNSLRFFVMDFVTDFHHSYELRTSQQRQPCARNYAAVTHSHSHKAQLIVCPVAAVTAFCSVCHPSPAAWLCRLASC